ncbi:hypothetical protein TYRP_000373 [Tyrophagus putrescentiae]|nr:hypothetical protein TYRP_000373 [Tyrophagus putrescentiae]
MSTTDDPPSTFKANKRKTLSFSATKMAKSSIILCFVLFALVFASATATVIYGGYGYPAYGYAAYGYRPAVYASYAYPAYGYGYYGGLGYYLRK